MIKLIKTDILSYESRLKQKEDRIHELGREKSYFSGKNYFDTDGAQNYLVFKSISSSFSRSVVNISSWRSPGIYDDSNTVLSSAANSTSVLIRLLNHNNRLGVTFRGNLLKMNRNIYNHGKITNI